MESGLGFLVDELSKGRCVSHLLSIHVLKTGHLRFIFKS